MTARFRRWLTSKWQRNVAPSHEALAQAHRATFGTLFGQLVLHHWLDSVYCTVYEGTDPLMLAYHNGRRSVLQELLETLDVAESPDKYEVKGDVYAKW